MTQHSPRFSSDQVLEAFSMEMNADGETLQRYLREYPECAEELVDLSREIFSLDIDDDMPLSSNDLARIDSALSLMQGAFSKMAPDPFANLSLFQSRELSQRLGVPRQVISAFRERIVLASSVPKRFLETMAASLGSNAQTLREILSQPPQTLARSYKADVKPLEAVQVTFEKLLRDADLSDDQIKVLLADES